MQQSSTTPKKQDVGRGLRKIVAYCHSYLKGPSCITSFWHGVISTGFFDFCTCSLIFHSMVHAHASTSTRLDIHMCIDTL